LLVWNLVLFNRAFLGNGFGVMCMRERHAGELWLTPNLTVRGVGGVQMNYLGRMGWDSRRISGGVWGRLLVTPELRLETIPR
jgi:hypothetical protein